MASIMKSSHPQSKSAPKISTFTKNLFKLCISRISPGASPSIYKVLNFALDSPALCNSQQFFPSEISSSVLETADDLSPIDETELLQLMKYRRKANSTSLRLKPCYMVIREDSLDRNFDYSAIEVNELTKKLKKDLSIKGLFPIVSNRNVILKNPPLKNKKRKERSTFVDEKTSITKFLGTLKKYNLRKRFGFINIDEGIEGNKKIFLCEDDLILSGVNYKHFKESVYKKQKISLRFNISKHIHEGKEVQKAIEIEILN